jgi:hypothetical protein
VAKTEARKPNITTKVISEPNVATVVETNFKLDTTTIEVDNQMAIIQVQVGKNIVEDVLLNGRASVNIVTKYLKIKLSLPKPRPFPYHFKMVDQNMTRPLRIIHGIPYIVTFTMLKNNVVDSSYSMLLGRPWLIDANVTHD